VCNTCALCNVRRAVFCFVYFPVAASLFMEILMFLVVVVVVVVVIMHQLLFSLLLLVGPIARLFCPCRLQAFIYLAGAL